jgi:hypothetical protein
MSCVRENLPRFSPAALAGPDLAYQRDGRAHARSPPRGVCKKYTQRLRSTGKIMFPPPLRTFSG